MKITFVTTATLFVVLSAAVRAAPSDVPPGHWAAGSVQRVTQKKLMQPGPDGKFNGDKPVTRYELAVTLDRFVRYMEAGRKPLHATSARSATIPPGTPLDVKQAIVHLTAGGYLPAKSPIVTAPGNKPVTARELAHALAQVAIRVSDRELAPDKD